MTDFKIFYIYGISIYFFLSTFIHLNPIKIVFDHNVSNEKPCIFLNRLINNIIFVL